MAKIYSEREILEKAKSFSSYNDFFKYLDENNLYFDLHTLENPNQPSIPFAKYDTKEEIVYKYHLNEHVLIDGGIWKTIAGVITKKRITKVYNRNGEPVYYPEYFINCYAWYLKDHWYNEEAIFKKEER